MDDFIVPYARACLIYETMAMIVESNLCLYPFAVIKTDVVSQDADELL